MSAEADLLKEVPLFQLLDDKERTDLAVFFKNATGERIMMDVATRGDSFGELSMLERRAWPFSHWVCARLR